MPQEPVRLPQPHIPGIGAGLPEATAAWAEKTETFLTAGPPHAGQGGDDSFAERTSTSNSFAQDRQRNS